MCIHQWRCLNILFAGVETTKYYLCSIKLKQQIKNMIVKIFGSDFERFDVCTTGLMKSFGPYYVEIYKLRPPIIIPLGPIPLSFSKY